MDPICDRLVNKFNNTKHVIITDRIKTLLMFSQLRKKFSNNDDYIDFLEKFIEHCKQKKIIFAYGNKYVPEVIGDICDFTKETINNLSPREWDELQDDVDDCSWWISYMDDLQKYGILEKESIIESIDAYGGCVFDFNNKKYSILNTYGEEDNYTVGCVFTACLVNHNSKKIIVFDVIYDPTKKIFFYHNYGEGNLTNYIYHQSIGAGKRGFYYNHVTKTILVRYNKSNYKDIPTKYKYMSTDQLKCCHPYIKIKINQTKD